MPENKYDFSIVCEKLDELSKEYTPEDLEEYEAIRTLGEIVSEIQDPAPTYRTST